MKKSEFLTFMGNKNIVKIIDLFLDNQSFYYSVEEISEILKMKYEKAHEAIELLSSSKVIKLKSSDDKSNKYILNASSMITKAFMDIDNELICFNQNV